MSFDKRIIENCSGRYLYAVIALLSLAFMIWHADDTSFWYDEFAQLDFSGEGKTLLASALTKDATPPLFNVLANIWYHLVPYGQRWLLLLPQLAMAAAVCVTALWAELLVGRTAGVFAALILGFSQMVIEQCGFEFRGYGFYLLLASLCFYLHARRAVCGNKPRLMAAYVLSLCGLLYAHLFGSLIVASLALWDLALTREKRLKQLAPYLTAGLLFLPWVIYFFNEIVDDFSGAKAVRDWMIVPTLWDVVKLGTYLCGNHIVVCALSLFGAALALRDAICTKTEIARERLVPLAAILFMVTVMLIFAHIRANYSTLWVKRYFTGLFPCAAVLAGWGAQWAYEAVRRGKTQRRAAVYSAFLVAALFAVIVPVFLYKTAADISSLTRYAHREAAVFLNEQADIENEDVIVLSTLGDFTDDWYAYYVVRAGLPADFHAESLYDLGPEKLASYRVVYVDEGFLGFPEETERALALLNGMYRKSDAWPEYQIVRFEQK